MDVVFKIQFGTKNQWKRLKFQFQGSIPRSAFVPGEEIKVDLHVRNNSTEKFVKAELKLMQRVLLRGAIDITSMPSSASANMIQHLSDESQEIRKVAKSAEVRRFKAEYSTFYAVIYPKNLVQMIEIAKNSSSQLKLSLRIPAVAQSFDSCAIIKLEYFLKVYFSYKMERIISFQIKIKTSSALGPSVKTQVPIIIGTIPLVDESAPNLIDFDLGAPPDYSEQPSSSTSPPEFSYQESVFGRHATSKEANHTEVHLFL